MENVNLATTRIVMPSTDVSIQATYRDKPGALFELSIANGTGSGEYAAAVTVAMIADAPPAGFVFAGWIGQIATVENISSADTWLYMPPNEVAVTATYKAAAITAYTPACDLRAS